MHKKKLLFIYKKMKIFFKDLVYNDILLLVGSHADVVLCHGTIQEHLRAITIYLYSQENSATDI